MIVICSGTYMIKWSRPVITENVARTKGLDCNSSSFHFLHAFFSPSKRFSCMLQYSCSKIAWHPLLRNVEFSSTSTILSMYKQLCMSLLLSTVWKAVFYCSVYLVFCDISSGIMWSYTLLNKIFDYFYSDHHAYQTNSIDTSSNHLRVLASSLAADFFLAKHLYI